MGRGISKHPKTAPPAIIEWDAVGLGELPDADLAQLLGTHPDRVGFERRKRQIPAWREKSTRISWLSVGLGTRSDVEIAREVGVSPATVALQRGRRGIAPSSRRVQVDWNAQPLGQLPDSSLAAALGISTHTVWAARTSRGIASFRRRTANIDWTAVELGALPDSVIAATLSCHPSTVQAARERLGIPPASIHFLMQEGFPARSGEEAMYDAWLHENAIGHEHEPPVGGGKQRADFLIGDLYVEIVGMRGAFDYDLKLARKLALYGQLDLRVQCFSPEEVYDFFSTCSLPLRTVARRTCEKCGAAPHARQGLPRGLCVPCYSRDYLRRVSVLHACSNCGGEFLAAPSARRKFCGASCYHASRRGPDLQQAA